jgi:hypothetical protein
MSSRWPSAQPWTSISMNRYYGTNCLVGSKDEIHLPAETPEDVVVNYAYKNGYKVVVKGPETQWYLKGKNSSYDTLKVKLEMNMNDPKKKDNDKYKNRYAILIKCI